MNSTALDPLIGQLLDGRYRVEARVAVGGMATVYRAMDTRLDRVLALKVMHPSMAVDNAFVDRFIREAKSAARLSHSNVVGVFDQGTDGTYVYLAMEYVAGCTLRDVLRERGALQPRAALDILEPVLAGLGAAHRAGLVHRDIKPENVLIGDDGRVKVADFGLVRTVDTHTQTTGTVLGTVSYLAPEQIEHGTTDARVDVYACGMTLYEMLTGHKPYSGTTPAQVIYQHLNEDVTPPSVAVPGLPPELDALVLRAAARDPQQRPGDAVELLADARNARDVLSGAQLDAVPPRAAEVAAAAGAQPTGAGPRPTAGSEDHTSVIPHPAPVGNGPPLPAAPPAFGPTHPVNAAGAQGPLDRTSQLELPLRPPEPPGTPPGVAPSGLAGVLHGRRRLVALVGAVLLGLGLSLGIWYVNSGQFTQTPSVLSVTEKQARDLLDKAGLDVKVQHAYSDTVQAGRVISSDPEPGERIRDTGTVTITVSQGSEIITVPELTDTTRSAAEEQLRNLGLTPGEVTHEFNVDVAQGSVIRTDPGAGEKRRPRTAVNLVISKGVAIVVPQVVGEPENDARELLLSTGFKVKIAEERVFSEHEAGEIAKQSVSAGDDAAAGQTITLTLSKGPDMLSVPNVEGMNESKATEALESAGFKVSVRRIFFTGKVWDQSPEGGEKAPRGSDITIWVR